MVELTAQTEAPQRTTRGALTHCAPSPSSDVRTTRRVTITQTQQMRTDLAPTLHPVTIVMATA